ncbi:ABC transporter substrate-binding protein [Halomonas sp. PA16-9]|uniref:ABC transporter substrate-binding protein n=1 Tax=Halomonas sp. PA16-9 TaxID=2576841 RepID=UPI0030EEAD01
MVLANSHVLVYNVTDPVLDDPRIRQAMNLAIDRELLNKHCGGEAVVPNGHQYIEFGDMYNPDHVGLEYDVERAKALLAESDYAGELIRYSTSRTTISMRSMPRRSSSRCGRKSAQRRTQCRGEFRRYRQCRHPGQNLVKLTRYPDPVGGLWNLGAIRQPATPAQIMGRYRRRRTLQRAGQDTRDLG